MRFGLVDRVVEVVPGERIIAVKAVSLSEEYLADHFPTFPVLPGVLMLEALVEAARWLAGASEDFAHSLMLLREAKNVTYKSFVKPGQTLRVEVHCRRLAQGESDFTGTGYCTEREVVKARFSLTHWNLADTSPELAPVDRRLREAARRRWALLNGAAP
ncbi:MAG: 3-hydroxyacyl-ACP dehydratase FabZ family protein [Planctomycetota bacterium]|jgi:3-hydroxyacyl-[acyl-carrier-protein] dehydratase